MYSSLGLHALAVTHFLITFKDDLKLFFFLKNNKELYFLLST